VRKSGGQSHAVAPTRPDASGGTHPQNNFHPASPVRRTRRQCKSAVTPTQAGVWRNGMALPADLRTLAPIINDAAIARVTSASGNLAPREFRGAVPVEFRGDYQSWLAANVLERFPTPMTRNLWDEQGREQNFPLPVDALTDAAIRTSTRISRIRFSVPVLPRAASPEPLRSLSRADGLREEFRRRLDAARPGGAAGSAHQHCRATAGW